MKCNDIYVNLCETEGAAAARAHKRAKIIDSDNEEEEQVPGGEGDENQAPQVQDDQGGESSDEGVRNDTDQQYVRY